MSINAVGSAVKTDDNPRWRMAGWLTLAAIPYFVWKLLVAAAVGALGGAMLAFLAVLTALTAALLFGLGAVLGGGRGAGNRSNALSLTLATWAALGFILDTGAGMLAASYLARVAAALGDSQAGDFWTDISAGDALLFLLFSAAGGIAGGVAAAIYRSRG